MVDFSNLKAADVTAGATSRYTFYELEGAPWLEVRPATEANKPYYNAVLRRGMRHQSRVKVGAVTADLLDETRDEDRVLYAEHIGNAWGRVKDATNKEVKFSKENLAEWLVALPNWVFDNLRQHCGNPQSFVNVPDAGTLAGNSKGGSSGS